MDIKAEIAGIEARLKRAGVPMSRFYRHAGIHPKTWARWRAGDPPTLRRWDRSVAAAGELAPAPAREEAA